MLLSDLIRSSATGITINRGRSFLTMLGIIIGVGSVVLMISLGNSFQHYILTQIESFGKRTIDVYPTGFEKFGGNLDSMTFEDAEEIEKLTTVTSVAPVILVGRPVRYGREEVSPLVFGTHPTIFQNYGLKIDRGRLLEQSDIDGAKNVVVVAAQTAEDLFGNKNPLGERIEIGGMTFTVVGVLEGLGSLLLQDLDTPVYMPLTTARTLTGQKHLNFINVQAVEDTELARADITSLLRQMHDIENPENDSTLDDFIARSGEQVTAIISSVTLGLTIFLGLVAAISLLVGGIGIMNIMLVTVTERTREIGLRKAVGAKRRDILLQFLLEAVALTCSGGLIGIAGGAYIGWLLSSFANKVLGEFSYSLSIPAILLALLMAASTGLIFGLYPAKRAASLSPMEALRYE